MPELQPPPGQGFEVRRDQPLMGVIVQQGDDEIVRYFTDEAEADQVSTPRGIQRALNLAGAWQDMDWAEALDELDRIRHESRPTPPIDL